MLCIRKIQKRHFCVNFVFSRLHGDLIYRDKNLLFALGWHVFISSMNTKQFQAISSSCSFCDCYTSQKGYAKCVLTKATLIRVKTNRFLYYLYTKYKCKEKRIKFCVHIRFNNKKADIICGKPSATISKRTRLTIQVHGKMIRL